MANTQTTETRQTHRSMNENSNEMNRQTMRNGMQLLFARLRALDECMANSYRSKVDLSMHQNSV